MRSLDEKHVTDTIFAPASGSARAGVSIIRISGPRSDEVLDKLLRGHLPRPRFASLRKLRHPETSEIIDEALVLRFTAPASFTGEDMAELHVHGSPAVVEALGHVLYGLGLRMAEAGEFTRRAFQNGRMDLTEAEGLADLIDAQTERQRVQALRQMDGGLRDKYEGWRDTILDALAQIEGEIDFPDEGDVPDELAHKALPGLKALSNELQSALDESARGEAIRHGVDIAIIGAGPAGTTAALALRNSGLNVALIDKATFPRDKICGDAIPSLSFKAVQQFAPELATQMFDFQETTFIKSAKVIAPTGKFFKIDWVLKAYNCARLDFDFQLFMLVKTSTQTTIFENEKVNEIEYKNSVFTITTTQQKLSAKIVIGADGTNGVTAKKLTNFSLDRNHHCAAVRAYYSNIKMEEGVNECYILKDYLPGYFWIFPLPNGRANVGFGMMSKQVKERKINLTKSLQTIIETTPILQEKFAGTQLEGKILGFGLPFGSRKATLCGNGFMLCGDAGSLIDPLQGHGIDKAIWSGQLAARQAIKCFEKQRFDADFLKAYERAVYKKFGWEFKRNYWLMRGLNRFSGVLGWLARLF